MLVGLDTVETWPCSLQGLSLRNVTLTLSRGKKVLYTELGEMLFTHFGVSGPLVLEASCHLPEDLSKASLRIDLKPGLTPEQLDARLLRDFAASGKKLLPTELARLLPASLAEIFPRLCGLPESLRCNQVSPGPSSPAAASASGKWIRPPCAAACCRTCISPVSFWM